MSNTDGKVTISTALDNRGLERGIRGVSGSLGGLKGVVTKLAAAISAAFAVQKIIQFGKAAVETASQLNDAMTGLQSILEGQGRSFAAAQRFIEAYTADGLIPAANAVAAYKNLAARGYSDDQIVRTLTALKDAAAFGRQSSYTMGDAVQSATEGLKNENSVLVDNAGVTKNVAKMWDDYAASIGTTSNQLTTQQKIEAEVNGILEETRFQTGDAAKVAGNYSGQVAQLSAGFTALKAAVGNAILPLAQRVLPVINTILQALTRLANAAATVMGALFGKATVGTAAGNSATADSAYAAAEGEQALADATEAAGKAAKGATAGFDELNILQQDTGSEAAAAASGGAGAGTVTTDAEVQDTISPKLAAVADKIRQLMEPLRQIDLGPLTDSLTRLKEAAAPLTKTLFEGLEWAWNELLAPLAAWTCEDLLPAFLRLLTEALRILNEVLTAVAPLIDWLWQNILAPLAERFGVALVEMLEWMAGVLRDVADGLEGWRVVLSSLPAVWEDVKTAAADAWDGVCAFWAGAAEWFDRTVLTPLSEGWETFRDGFSTLWSGITELVKQEVNGIIGFINSMIAAAVDGINAVIALLNGLSFTVPDWVPALGGMQWGFDLPTFTAPQIPLLAQGAVLPANRPFLAVVGDQRSGTNVEAPLELIRATVQEANADLMAQVIGALRSAPDSERPIQVELLLDGRKLASVLAKRSKEQGAGLMGSQVYSY